MVLEIITVGFMFGTVVVKWAAASALQTRQSRLSEASEQNAHARQRFKMAVGEVSITDREIEKLQRKIKSSERKISLLQTEADKLTQAAKEKSELDREKLRLAQKMKKNRGSA